MGEASVRSRNRTRVLAGETQCIYCLGPPTSVEHMPPVAMFARRHRLSGFEFPTCTACNNGTRGADAVAAMFARFSQTAEIDDPLNREAMELRKAVIQRAPGVYEELVSSTQEHEFRRRTPSGIIEPVVRVRAGGPLLKGYLDAFSTKLGLALFREHVGNALPPDGAVMARWFLNAGLTQQVADTILQIMPAFATLTQGRQTAAGQFRYRYNSDDKTVVAALSQFHEGLYVFNIATAVPDAHGLPKDWMGAVLSKPGDLLRMIPSAPRQIHMLGQKPPAA